MTQTEKREEIYTLVYGSMYNKTLEDKEWQAIRKSLSKMLKKYAEVQPQIIYKEKVIFKERPVVKKRVTEDNYWSM